MTLLRRLGAAGLLGAVYLPVHRLLAADTGPAGAATRDVAENAWVLGLTGTIIVVVFAWVIVRMAPARPTDRSWEDRLSPLLGPSDRAASLLLGGASFLAALLIASMVHRFSPTSVDEMVQLAHAQALAAGRLGVPLDGAAGAWLLQNGVPSDVGWVSIYPPLHTSLLALGILLGVPWMVGPIMTGVATGAATALAQRWIGPLEGRLLGIFLLVSPFWLLLGASHLSHTSAAAGLALVGLTASRAVDTRRAIWALGTGAAIGLAVGARPWVGLVGAAVLVAFLWAPIALRDRAAFVRYVGLAGIGGAPFAAMLLAWNARLFGHPLRLGYSAAFGPAHSLGFGTDPWGNEYGIIEAVGYTGADLAQLGVRLLESPLPIVALVGFFLLGRPLPAGARLFALWAAAAVCTNLVYWHHGVHFGPRMLFESAPAWLALVAVVVATTLRGRSDTTEARVGRTVVIVTLAGGLALAPLALRHEGGTGLDTIPAPSVDGAATVFVHGSWASRVSSQLVADGMRRDSVETLLRRNDLCLGHRYMRARLTGDVGPDIDFTARPGSGGHLQVAELSRGNMIRVDPSLTPDPACVREARSDRFGVLELELLAWELPLSLDGVAYVRDLGPGPNAAVLEARPGPAYVLIDATPTGSIQLVDYDEGMEMLWGGVAGR